MSITVVKEQDTIRVLSVSGELPSGRPVTFFAHASSGDEMESLLDAQMPSFIRGDEGESAVDLFPVR